MIATTSTTESAKAAFKVRVERWVVPVEVAEELEKDNENLRRALNVANSTIIELESEAGNQNAYIKDLKYENNRLLKLQPNSMRKATK